MVRDGIILLIQECNNAKLIVKKMMMALINGMRREYHLTGYTQDVNAGLLLRVYCIIDSILFSRKMAVGFWLISPFSLSTMSSYL